MNTNSVTAGNKKTIELSDQELEQMKIALDYRIELLLNQSIYNADSEYRKICKAKLQMCEQAAEKMGWSV